MTFYKNEELSFPELFRLSGYRSKPHCIRLSQPPLQRYMSMVFAHNRHRLPVMPESQGSGLGVFVITVCSDEVIQKMQSAHLSVQAPPQVIVHRHMQLSVHAAHGIP